MSRIITWQSPSGHTVNVTRKQEKMMRKHDVWPRDSHGGEFCSVSHGLRVGQPTWADVQVERIIQVEMRRFARGRLWGPAGPWVITLD